MLRRYAITLIQAFVLPLLFCNAAEAAVPDIKSRPDANGNACVSLRNIARYYGLEYSTGKKQTIILRSKWSRFVFTEKSRKCYFNGTLVWLNEPLSSIRKRPAITIEDLHMVIDPLLRPDTHLPDLGYQVVLLDPGHGGNDKGTQSPSGTAEKDIVLDIAKRARAKLANAGCRVHMTRNSDRYLSLESRAAKTKKTGADVFVSIHMNSTGNQSAAGIETFLLSIPGHLSTNDSDNKPGKSQKERHTGNKYNKANSILAYHLHQNLHAQVKSNDRGIKRARFAVLKNAECPAVLVECGFLSNRKEEKLFKDPAYRQQVADALAEGILDYLSAVKRAKAAMP